MSSLAARSKAGLIARRGRPPRWPYTLNQDSPQAQGLILWAPLGARGVADDLIRHRAATLSGVDYPDLKPAAWAGGRGLDLQGGTRRVIYPATPGILSGNRYTLTIWTMPTAWPGFGQNVGLWGSRHSSLSTTTWTQFVQPGTTSGKHGKINFTCQNGGSEFGVDTLQTVDTGAVTCLVGRRNGTVVDMFRDGVSQGSASGVGAANHFSTTPFNIGNYYDFEFRRGYTGVVFDARLYDYDVPDDLVFEMYDPATRFDLYYELGRRQYYRVPAAGGATPNLAAIMHHYRQQRMA